MPIRTIVVDGTRWEVMPSGHVTQYERDEFALLFTSGEGGVGGGGRRVRVTRYSPQGTRTREQSLAQLTDADLARLLSQSQPSATSPEAGYQP
jgi:hypothetical protein